MGKKILPKMKKEITVLTSAHSRYDVRIYHKELISLKKKYNSVKLIVLDGKGNTISADGIEIIDINVKKRKTNRFNRFTIFQYLIVKYFKNGKHLIHFHDSECFVSIFFLKILFNQNFIYDVHENLIEDIKSKQYIPKFLRRSLAFITNVIENFIVAKAKGVITATPYLKNKYLKRNKNVESIINYPEVNIFKSCSEYSSRTANSVVYVGVINEIRGVFEVMDAIDYFPDNVRFSVAGPFTTEKVKNTFFKHKNINKVDYFGILDRVEIHELLNKSLCGILIGYPVKNALDSIPIKLYEYLACGLPVIISDYPKWKTFIKNNQVGFTVDCFDTKMVGLKVAEIIKNKKKSSEMSQLGRQLFESKYNWEDQQNKLYNFYENII